MKKLSVQGVDYAYWDIGTAPAIIFAHGLFVDHSMRFFTARAKSPTPA